MQPPWAKDGAPAAIPPVISPPRNAISGRSIATTTAPFHSASQHTSRDSSRFSPTANMAPLNPSIPIIDMALPKEELTQLIKNAMTVCLPPSQRRLTCRRSDLFTSRITVSQKPKLQTHSNLYYISHTMLKSRAPSYSIVHSKKSWPSLAT